MKEIYKDIEGYEGIYKISNTGKVYSVKNGIVLKTVKRKASKTEYEYLTLVKNKVKKTHTIHRLVAIHFIENKDNKPCVNHIDNNGLNNHVSNLEWVTYSENLIHAQKQGRLYEAQSKGGKVTTAAMKIQADLDAKAMVGKIYQNYRVIEHLGLKPVGTQGVERHFLVCECVKCGARVETTKEHINSLGKEQCRKCKALRLTEEKYTKVKKELVGTVINEWLVLDITKPVSVIRSCKLHVKCTKCGTYEYIPYGALSSSRPIKSCKNCK